MPPLSRWAIRAALLYLLTGFTIGGLLLVNKGFPAPLSRALPGLWRLLPLHIELLLTGWLVQFIMGVAFWILPRSSEFFGAPLRRGNLHLARAAFLVLNGGILLAMLSVAFPAGLPLLLAGRVIQVLAVVLFVLHAWPRVKPFLG